MKKHIALIENDSQVHVMLRRMFAKCSPYEIKGFFSAESFREKADLQNVLFAIVDYGLPGQSGANVGEILEENAINYVVISAQPDVENGIAGRRPLKIFPKPFPSLKKFVLEIVDMASDEEDKKVKDYT